MNILLTGGAGYIGSHMALALRQAGFAPVVLDNLSGGHEGAIKYGPLVKGDIGDVALVQQLCAEYQPKALLHFAAFIEVAESVANPAKYMENNFTKASRLFDTVRAAGVGQAVFSSTAAVYGMPQSDAALDEKHPLHPINPYGESKLAAETYLRGLDSRGLRSMVLRYFNAAGAAPLSEGIGEAHKPESHLLPNAVLAGLGLKPALQIFGNDYPTPDGTAIRDYVHVQDLAAAHVAALRYLLDGGASDVCNLGTGTGSSVQQVIAAVEQALGKPVPKQMRPRRAGDPPRLVANASRAQTVLGWRAERDLAEMAASAVAWHRTEVYRRLVSSYGVAKGIFSAD